MSSRYPRIYAALKRAGFSPAKAVEVLFDAKRGDVSAINWVRLVRTIAVRRAA
jgi:hypothetical protein